MVLPELGCGAVDQVVGVAELALQRMPVSGIGDEERLKISGSRHLVGRTGNRLLGI